MKLNNFNKKLVVKKLENKDEFIKRFVSEFENLHVRYPTAHFFVDFNKILSVNFMQNIKIIDRKINKVRDILRPDIVERNNDIFFDSFFSVSKYRFEDILKYDISKLFFSFDEKAQQKKLFEKIKFYFDFLQQNRKHIRKEEDFFDYFTLKFLDNEDKSNISLLIDLYYDSSMLNVKVHGLVNVFDNPARLRNVFDSKEIAKKAIELTAKAHKEIKNFLFDLSKELILKSLDTEEKMRDPGYTFLELKLFKKNSKNNETQNEKLLLNFKISENKVLIKNFIEADKKDIQKFSDQLNKIVKYIFQLKYVKDNFNNFDSIVKVLFQNFLCKYDKDFEQETDRILNLYLSS